MTGLPVVTAWVNKSNESGVVEVKDFSGSLKALACVAVVATLAGCAAESRPADPGFRPLPSGMSCQSVRSELNALDSRGTGSKVEAVSSGRKVSDKDRADVQRYNTLLNYYLAGRCHV